MPANASPEYAHAEKKFSEAQTDEERLSCLEEMIKYMPQHKSAESLRANLRTRYKKFKEKLSKAKKSGRSSQQGIRKAEMQAILVGPPNSGKSTVFRVLTNQKNKITAHPHSTTEPVLGTADYEDIKIQIIDTPSFPNTDKGLLHTTDTILLIIERLEDIEISLKEIQPTRAKVILLFNKIDNLTETEIRKIEANLKSKFKKYSYMLFQENMNSDQINEIKKIIFNSFPIIRVYTKEPKKEASEEPMILKKDSTLEEAAKKISKSLKNQTKFAKIWGPSSKFPGQIVGLNHILKDKDIIEIKI